VTAMVETVVEPYLGSDQDPLVTALLVCWNHERFVGAAVRSVLDQTHRNIQLIVFDNGSTDRSRDILRAMAAEHGFELVLQENVGLVRALNRGLRMAKGKYVALMATDDVWLPEKTRTQVDFFERHPDVGLTFGAVHAIDADGKRFDRDNAMLPYIGDVTLDDLLWTRRTTNGPTVMARTAALKRVGGYDEDIRTEDFAMAMKLAANGIRITGLPEVLTLYRRHDANWTALESRWRDIRDAGRKYCRTQAEYRRFIRERLAREFRSLARSQKIEALKLMWSAPVASLSKDFVIGLFRLALPSLPPKASRAKQSSPGRAACAGTEDRGISSRERLPRPD
jgi:alpha-1,3-rhamnosyltransferase